MLTGSSLSSLLVCPAPERSHKGHWQAQFGVALLVVPSELGEGRASSLLKPCIRKTYMIFFFWVCFILSLCAIIYWSVEEFRIACMVEYVVVLTSVQMSVQLRLFALPWWNATYNYMVIRAHSQGVSSALWKLFSSKCSGDKIPIPMFVGGVCLFCFLVEFGLGFFFFLVFFVKFGFC